MTRMTDEAELERIVEDVRAGGDSAFTQLVQRVRGRVNAWALRFTDDADVADDIAQDVMVGLQRRVSQYRGESRFTTWLFTLTRTAALNHTRTASRRSRIRERIAASATDTPASPEGTLDEQTVADLVLRYFDALPAKQRLIFELIDLKGESAADVARRLGMPAATVRAHLFKARRAIRAQMLSLHEPLVKEFFS